jgi:hypothetical protein
MTIVGNGKMFSDTTRTSRRCPQGASNAPRSWPAPTPVQINRLVQIGT